MTIPAGTFGRVRNLALGLLIAFASGASAQQVIEAPVVPEVGEEVRVIQRSARGAVHGLYVETTATEVVVRSIPGGGPISIDRGDITGMSVQRGTQSRAVAGALLGTGIGLVTGLILNQTTESFSSAGEAVGISVAVGLPVGLLIGLMLKSPQWDGVDMGALVVRPSLEWR
jgi:hypothetical protein